MEKEREKEKEKEIESLSYLIMILWDWKGYLHMYAYLLTRVISRNSVIQLHQPSFVVRRKPFRMSARLLAILIHIYRDFL
jgi:hypothetical protein